MKSPLPSKVSAGRRRGWCRGERLVLRFRQEVKRTMRWDWHKEDIKAVVQAFRAVFGEAVNPVAQPLTVRPIDPRRFRPVHSVEQRRERQKPAALVGVPPRRRNSTAVHSPLIAIGLSMAWTHHATYKSRSRGHGNPRRVSGCSLWYNFDWYEASDHLQPASEISGSSEAGRFRCWTSGTSSYCSRRPISLKSRMKLRVGNRRFASDMSLVSRLTR
jgi:hypothetical protein